jgi:cell division protein FtsI/penicillin-binding protein 2
VGYDALFRWAERFGFGGRTGYLDRERYAIAGSYRGFPEGEGKLKYSERGDANLMRFAIGQGAIDDVTPLQVARMMAGIATGKLPEVRLISRIGERVIEKAPARELAISRNHLDLVREAMEQVVIRGTAEPDANLKLDLRPYKVAGKTGTPQVGGGRPSHACFAGYFPWDEPRWSFACFIESCGLHGGEIAAPVINRILESEAAKPLMEGIEQ